jgi:hypothetical protein
MANSEDGAVKWVRKNAELRVEGVQVMAILQKWWFMKMRKMNFFYFIVTNDTDEHVITHDFSPLYHPLSLPFTAHVGMNVLGQSCESIMLFFDVFCTPEFYQHVDQTNIYASQVVSAAPAQYVLCIRLKLP